MQTVLTIDKGVAIPEARSCRYSNMRYPFRTMKPGDSFLLRLNGDGKKGLERERTLVLLDAKKHKVKVTTRTVPGGVRVWKIK